MMLLRVLIALLLCMNLGVAIWWVAQRQTPVPVATMTDAGIAPLVLLSESERQPTAQPVPSPSSPQPLAEGLMCLSLGPFATPADLRQAMDTLMPQVERIQFREVAAVFLRGYRVFLPSTGSREQALAVARALSVRGVTDFYVVTAGDQQNTVSLGIFRELKNATQRHDAIAALGYNPTIEARTEQAPQWWIELAADKAFVWQEAVSQPGLQAESVPCQ